MKENENDIHTTGDSEISSEPTSQPIEIDYEKIEQAYYNALSKIEQEKADKAAMQKVVPEDNSLEFSSATDAKLYTVGLVAPSTSVDEQQTAYILDIRNILLIFLLVYFCISIYGKLKTSLSNYYRG